MHDETVVTPSLLPNVPVHLDCRACATLLEPVFSLGNFAINAFPNPHDPVPPQVPLQLAWCPACFLVQLRHTTPPDLLFREYYYRSRVNEQMRWALEGVASDALGRVLLTKRDWVVDIGANDGTLLKYISAFQRSKKVAKRAAWEPARNLMRPDYPADLVVNEYFPKHVRRLRRGCAKLITAIAMVYDIEDLHAFLEGITYLLHPNGIWVVQFSDLLSMLQTNDFPSICHEHLEYYSLLSFQTLVERHGLQVVDVLRNTVNGGSLRVLVKHRSQQVVPGAVAIAQQLQCEQAAGLHRPLATGNLLQHFASHAETIREQLCTTMDRLHREFGVTMDGYGAATKGNILLQYCGFGPKQMRCIAERSPEKVGRLTVTSIPIISEEQWRAAPAPVTLVPIWPFRKGILEREHAYLEDGGQMLFPLPHVEVVIHV